VLLTALFCFPTVVDHLNKALLACIGAYPRSGGFRLPVGFLDPVGGNKEGS